MVQYLITEVMYRLKKTQTYKEESSFSVINQIEENIWLLIEIALVDAIDDRQMNKLCGKLECIYRFWSGIIWMQSIHGSIDPSGPMATYIGKDTRSW